MAGGLPPDQELDSDKLRTLTDALADLKIVGVRPKPPGLTRDLKKSDTEGHQAHDHEQSPRSRARASS